MATFQILEDTLGKINRNQLRIGERNAGKRENHHRIPLQIINDNQIRHDFKRIKLGTSEESAPILLVEAKKKVFTFAANVEEAQKTNDKEFCNKNNFIQKKKEKCDNIVDDLELHAEYLEDIWSYLLNKEKVVLQPTPNYMSKQPHISYNMRCVLVDWLTAVADEYNLSEQTLHLTVNYVDRFLSQMSVVSDKFQLLGSAAMMLAGKVEDIYPPDIKEWTFLTCNSYTSQQIERMEVLLLKVLKYDLQPPTILSFIQQLCVMHKLDKDTMYLAMYISELVLLEGDGYLKHKPSKLAAACVVLARVTLCKRPLWPKKLQKSSGYSLKQLSPVVQRQNRTFADSPTRPQKAIQTKYQASKYRQVALLTPKILNLDECNEE